MEKSINSDY